MFAGVFALAAGAGALGVALAFGGAVALMVAAFGPVSGAHFNPAVTLGFLLLRRIGLAEALRYLGAELSGALAAMLLLRDIWGAARLEAVAYGATRLAPEVPLWAGLGLELAFTFSLMLVIAGVVARAARLGPLYIGLTVAVAALAGGAFTGASLNPARSFGPAVVGGFWETHWLYWLGPFAGAALAAAAARTLWRGRFAAPG